MHCARTMLDLSWITPEIAIGGRFAMEHAEALVREHRIAAVVDLRAECCDEESVLRRHGLELLHLPTKDLCAVSAGHLREGVAFVLRHIAARHRVLIHCEHGIGRSALLALCVLVEHGHPPLDALLLAKSGRAKVSPSPEQYEAWAAWLQLRGHVVPSFDEFAAIVYRRG